MDQINEVVARSKDRTAVVDDQGTSLSYSEMMIRSRRLASSLVHNGVQRHQVVGVYLQPGTDSVCSILAIWSIGSTYLPLDTRVAPGRLQQILADCEPSAILCHDDTIESASELDTNNVPLVNVSALESETGAVLSTVKIDADDIAVILYTSGSTGAPKGLPIRHISLVNQTKAITDEFKIGAEVVLQQSAASFDVAMEQILMCLCNGGTLQVASQETRLDPLQITKLIATQKVTWVYATPSELSQWLGHGLAYLSCATSLRYILSSGETLPKSLAKDIQKLNKSGLRLINVYGPAEAGVVTATELDLADLPDSIPLGRPLSNVAVYVVDSDLRPVPAGVSGEILIAGAGNVESYLKKPELSATAFLHDTLTPNGLYQGQLPTVYRTGDMGRYETDGQLYFKGRIAGDLQVKINGVRIELEDIERSIIDAAGGIITNAVAVVKRDPDFLVAFVEFVQDLPNNQQQEFLKVLLQRLPLPRSMTPAMLIVTNMIPLNSHGKLDRRAVEAMPLPESLGGEDGPMSEIEVALRELWIGCLPESIMKATSIFSSSDFFNLGGNSYLLVHLQRLIRRRFNVHVPVMSLYDASSLVSMAKRITSGESVVAIDWHTETSITQALVANKAVANADVARPSAPCKRVSGLTVVLTGATGYMGSRILKSLAEDDRVAVIHCVALRNHSDMSPRTLAVDSPKLHLHTGEFSEPRIGLMEQDFDTLAETADVIVHSGANRAFWDYYDNLRGPNVNSTKALVDLAASRRTPIHFISSGGVHLIRDSSDTRLYPSESVAAFPPPSDGSNGYIASKWASEVYLEKAAKELHIPVSIHRFVPAVAGEENEPPVELLEELRDLALRLNALPAPSGWVGTFDLSPAGDLAADLAHSALDSLVHSEDEPVQTSPHFVHYVSKVKLSMESVRQYMEMLQEVSGDVEASGNTLQRLPPLMWAGKAKKEGLSWHFTSTDFVAMGGVEGVGLRR
jgi:hybrid polyketide synthase/nonribosomal peptide synthetase ACE1